MDLYLSIQFIRQKVLISINMKYFLILLTSVTFVSSIELKAQTTEDSVKAAVNLLFDGMRNSDPVKIRAAFSDSAVLQTIAVNREGKVRIINENVDRFAKSVSTLPKDSADERITFGSIHIDANLASVWTPYKFYYAGKFSHCGVNSFQLVRISGVWKIQYLIDTRRRTGCD